MTVLDLQRALRQRGFAPGPLDGIFGRLTRAAVIAFQTREGLPATGLADAATVARLSATPATPAEPVWLAEARRWMGLSEIAGARSNATILRWGRAIADWYRDDDTPWCGAFVHAQIAATLPDEPLPANALWARGWAQFGVGLATPSPGAILVFSRGTGGHVGFYVGEDATRLRVLGGNQSNAVTESWIAKARLLAVRWPKTAPAPARGRVASTAAGELSLNEA
ncbi:uncharacterized protein (TIGR02594 family) [Methylopila capsulata]|uniref:Uncharacterized protein (TIGR02594 family) n=1 Tax=Methylopila capsulata TaxID=61654 RepID=A0A9W6MS17_9HYPH|nr:TIGR02594 family protein [Methylopila capsulata]MBM7852099.1 uncharacterized protein (TIGR02594 family) [Methylopila capsulata]GLK56305.1 hypothetical protein GCM10008170_23240 [Methylopila capsulata]